MAGAPFAFISYRRSDAQQAALGLYFQLRLRFGSSKVFMDVGAIAPGDVWPERLRRALSRASVVIVLVGPHWLTAADGYGRRRLDQPEDWVRLEIESALRAGKTVIPVLIDGIRQLPPSEGLPLALRDLLQFQALELRSERWDDDVKALTSQLTVQHRFMEVDTAVMLPQPEVSVAALSEEELDGALQSLPGWEPVESNMPRDYPRSRHELRRAFRFKSFKRALAFMAGMHEPVSATQHHPRLENQWRTVIVYLSTWDIGHRISPLDIEMAQAIDALYEKQQALPASVPATR